MTYTRKSKYNGYCRSISYQSYRSMLRRCNNKNSQEYPHYGGKGIIVCQRWKDSYLNFIQDLGERPGLNFSIDRINNDGNYEISNCRWSTTAQQQRNKSSNVKLTYNGITRLLCEWASLAGISQKLLATRIRQNMPMEKALVAWNYKENKPLNATY